MSRALIFLLFSLILGTAHAQKRFFDAGLHGGVNFAQVDGDHLGGYNKVGALLGVHVGHAFSDRWHLRGEISYTQKGSRRRLDPEDPNPQIFILSFHYIELPLLATYSFDKFNLNGGLSIGRNVKAVRDEGLGFQDAVIKPWEIALHTSASYPIKERCEFELRHSTSLFRVGDDYPNGLNLWYRVGLYNRLWSMNLHYKLSKD